MASGSLNLTAFSRYGEIPLTTDTSPYSTLTMFAVSSNSYLTPYSFYDYTNASGFVDTSTLTTSIRTSFSNTKTYVSTIPLTQWYYTDPDTAITRIESYPFYYEGTVPRTFVVINIPTVSTFISSYTSVYYPPPISMYPGGRPIYQNPVLSTYTFAFLSTIPSYIEYGDFGTYTSSVLATPRIYDFTSTYNGITEIFPTQITTPSLWLGTELESLINTKQYNVFVDCKYSLYLSTSVARSTWVSTIGQFCEEASGQNGTTRCGDRTYMDIASRLMYNPNTSNHIGVDASSFRLSIRLQSTIGSVGNMTTPSFDLFVPGTENFTVTLVPLNSTIV